MIADQQHVVIYSPPLSGRTYLLEHIKFRVADGSKIPVLVSPDEMPASSEFKMETFLSNRLGFVSPKQVADLENSPGVVLLIDNLDKVPAAVRTALFQFDPKKLRVIATARSVAPPTNAREVHIGGVDWIQIVRFLRSLDNKSAVGKPFLDRAKQFLQRAFAASGLPENPFTIAVMLEECQHSSSRFSTPTMGRLIGRFIELQVGSHSDTGFRVDFETKREFLTRLAGHAHSSFQVPVFESILGKYIDSKGHPHSITDFFADLINSGAFQRVEDKVEWSHPVIREYFWVKSLVSKGRYAPIVRRLEKEFDTTLSALVGSQVEDGSHFIEALLPKLEQISLPNVIEIVESPDLAGSLSKMISDQDEEALLLDIESEKLLPMRDEIERPPEEKQLEFDGETKEQPRLSKLTTEERAELKKRIEPIMKRIAESELHIAYNVSAILLNARDTKRECKELAVDAIVASGQLLGNSIRDLVFVSMGESKRTNFISTWLSTVMLCSTVDEMLGDPHLLAIFKRRLKGCKDKTKMIALLDLLLCCGEEEHDSILEELRKTKLWV